MNAKLNQIEDQIRRPMEEFPLRQRVNSDRFEMLSHLLAVVMALKEIDARLEKVEKRLPGETPAGKNHGSNL
jgi:hypothetical protein